MNMPGFTAEASLYRASNGYHGAATFQQADRSIHAAQAFFGPGTLSQSVLGGLNLRYIVYAICLRGCDAECGPRPPQRDPVIDPSFVAWAVCRARCEFRCQQYL
jgi:hypothetical protein